MKDIGHVTKKLTFFSILGVICHFSMNIRIEVRFILIFHFSSPSGFNAIHAFNMRFHVSQKHIAKLLHPMFDILQFVVSICQKGSHGTISCFWNLFLSNNYNRKNTDNGRTSITSCAYRDFISCNIILYFWYCLACCIFYSTKSKETSMKRSASAHVSLKYRQRIFFSLLRAYCFPNNFD